MCFVDRRRHLWLGASDEMPLGTYAVRADGSETINQEPMAPFWFLVGRHHHRCCRATAVFHPNKPI
jgi:hypothetical protein